MRKTLREDVASRRTFIKYGGTAGTVGLAGCLGGDDTGAQAGSAGEEEVEIEFWHIFGDVLGGHLEDIVEEFNERDNNITVNLTSQGGYGENFQTTMSSINAGNPPHIALFSTGDGVAAMESGQYIPVVELLEDRIDFESRFMEPVLDYFSVPGDDRYFSLPMNNSTAIMNYNRDMFAEAGLDPDDPPSTFAEVRDVSQTLVDKTQAEHGCAWANVTWFIDQWHGWDDSFSYDNNNGRENDGAGPNEILLTSEPARNIYQWWQEMYEDDLYMATQQGWGDASGAAMQSWDVGITLGSTAGLGRTADIAQEASQPFELGAAPLFVPNERSAGMRVGGGSLWVPEMAVESSAEEEALIDFFDWITSPEPQAEWFRRTGYFPINVESRETLEAEGFFEENPAWTAGFDSIEMSDATEATRLSIVPSGPEIGPELMDLYTELRQGADLDETLQNYKETIDGIIQS